MVVGRYRRTVSFPNPSQTRPSKPPSNSYHTRSTSLPCRSSHPLIPHLKAEINGLKSWLNESRANSLNGKRRTTSSWLNNGLSKLKSIHESLDDILQLPQTQDSLSSRPDFVDKALEDFLRFVDVYGIFQTSMLGLQQELSAAQVAIRRKDNSKLGLYVKGQTEAAKEMSKLLSIVRCIERQTVSDQDNVDDDEISLLICDVHEVTTSVSAVVFDGIAAWLMPARRLSWIGSSLGFSRRAGRQKVEEQGKGIGIEDLWGLRKKGGGDEEMRMGLLKKMKELEDCVSGLENGSERVFRSSICIRVSLLNVLTHT
ncbi:hypothetical protein Ancab_035418 [Ancistrocladus abbreviatus]